MKLTKIIILIFIIISLIIINEVFSTNSSNKLTNKEITFVNSNNQIKLRFEEFTLEIDSIEIWDEEKKLRKIQKDTAKVYLELGETIENQLIKIDFHKKGGLKIYQRFENSITFMNEGPHCDLIDWKHYDSKWEELKIKNNKFLTKSYTEKDYEEFINIDIKEVKNAVKNQCGDGWFELIKNIESPLEYPSVVSTSRIFLKIEYRNESDKTINSKIISFEIPMGC